MIKLDWTITIGEVFQVLSILIIVFSVYNKLTNSITALQTDVSVLKKWWENYIMTGNQPPPRQHTNSRRNTD